MKAHPVVCQAVVPVDIKRMLLPTPLLGRYSEEKGGWEVDGKVLYAFLNVAINLKPGSELMALDPIHILWAEAGKNDRVDEATLTYYAIYAFYNAFCYRIHDWSGSTMLNWKVPDEVLQDESFCREKRQHWFCHYNSSDGSFDVIEWIK